MEYYVHLIENEEQLSSCPVFEVNNFLWDSKIFPRTFGKMGYLEGEGLKIQMVCYELNPLRQYTNPMDPVCKDSAMEAFLAFPSRGKDDMKNFIPYNDCLYMNFEINANGAMHAKYGWGRKGRTPLTNEEYRSCNCKAKIEKDSWNISLTVPEKLLKKIYGIDKLEEKSTFWCNFYKISEDESIEHYAAFSPIKNPTPNFHLPEFFGKAIIK